MQVQCISQKLFVSVVRQTFTTLKNVYRIGCVL